MYEKDYIKAQEKYCKDNNLPRFAPEDGICWACERNIYKTYNYDEITSSGYSYKRASSELITHCPHCLRTFCD